MMCALSVRITLTLSATSGFEDGLRIGWRFREFVNSTIDLTWAGTVNVLTEAQPAETYFYSLMPERCTTDSITG